MPDADGNITDDENRWSDLALLVVAVEQAIAEGMDRHALASRLNDVTQFAHLWAESILSTDEHP